MTICQQMKEELQKFFIGNSRVGSVALMPSLVVNFEILGLVEKREKNERKERLENRFRAYCLVLLI